VILFATFLTIVLEEEEAEVSLSPPEALLFSSMMGSSAA
jgi:hypothetical protein